MDTRRTTFGSGELKIHNCLGINGSHTFHTTWILCKHMHDNSGCLGNGRNTCEVIASPLYALHEQTDDTRPLQNHNARCLISRPGSINIFL